MVTIDTILYVSIKKQTFKQINCFEGGKNTF